MVNDINDHVIVYTSASCVSCRKVIDWFKKHNVKYIEKRILITPLKNDEIKRILNFTKNGWEDIVSKRSKIIREKKIDLGSLQTEEAIDLIQQYPTILRRPILLKVSTAHLMVGFNEENIEIFLRNLKSSEAEN